MVIVTEIDTGNILDEEVGDEEYGDEVLCCEWNPDVASIAGGITGYAQQLVAALRTNFAETDVDAFMNRMYLSQE
jgi:hypothetical protein